MADPTKDQNIETSEQEHDAIRNANDRDQALEREGIESRRNRGYDEAVRGQGSAGRGEGNDVDPDSADAEIDRDDTVEE